MMAVTCTLCPIAQDYTGLVLYAVGFGVFDGCFVLLLAITTSDIVGPGKLPAALGGLYGVIAFPMTFGPPLAGMCVLTFFFLTVSSSCCELGITFSGKSSGAQKVKGEGLLI